MKPVLLNLPEKNRFFRGLVSWVGFKSINIPFDVQERPDGTGSKWSILKLIVYSIKNITSFTSLPLIWVIYVGVFFLFASAILFFQTLYNYYSGNALNGFTTVILVSILLSGIMLIQLGIMGLYISQVFDEVKNRPCFIIRKPK
jgi:dolichol-phosphate mannosyltransferase